MARDDQTKKSKRIKPQWHSVGRLGTTAAHYKAAVRPATASERITSAGLSLSSCHQPNRWREEQHAGHAPRPAVASTRFVLRMRHRRTQHEGKRHPRQDPCALAPTTLRRTSALGAKLVARNVLPQHRPRPLSLMRNSQFLHQAAGRGQVLLNAQVPGRPQYHRFAATFSSTHDIAGLRIVSTLIRK